MSESSCRIMKFRVRKKKKKKGLVLVLTLGKLMMAVNTLSLYNAKMF